MINDEVNSGMVLPLDESIDQNVFSLLKEVSACYEYYQKGESERVALACRTEAVVSLLQNRRKILIDFMNNKYGERKQLYSGYFQLLEKALETGNDQVVEIALESIYRLYSDSAFEGIDIVCEQYDKIDKVIKI